MNFLKRLLEGSKKTDPEPSSSQVRGAEAIQTQGEVDATRKHMEDEMLADRTRRQGKAEESASPEP